MTLSPSAVIPASTAAELDSPAAVFQPAPTQPAGKPDSVDRADNPLLDGSSGDDDKTEAASVLRGPALADLPVVDFMRAADRAFDPSIDRLATGGVGHHDGASAADPGRELAASEAEVDRAYQLGWAEGNAAAKTAIAEAASRGQQALAAAIAEMRTMIDQQRGETDELVVELAVEIARLILDREVATATDPGRDALVRCLAEIAPSTPATFRLNPVDLAALDGIDELSAGRPIEVVADPTVRSGDAVVELAGGRIDGTIAGALERVAEVLAP